jgi:enoyl-CoA hydratase/carnithine racemase
MITTNTNNPQSSLKDFDFETAQAIVLEKYGSTPEDAKKWGFVENTWEDKQSQEARWKAFVEKAMKGDPWEGIDGKDAF